MKLAPRSIAICILAMASSACSTTSDYPSLARRDAERITGSAEPAPPPPPQPETPGADTSNALARLTEAARTAHRRFSALRGRAEQLAGAAQGSARGSENWSVAAIAIAELDSARSQAMVALADVDRLYAADRLARYNEESADAKAMAESRDRIAAWVDEQDRILANLGRRLGI